MNKFKETLFESLVLNLLLLVGLLLSNNEVSLRLL